MGSLNRKEHLVKNIKLISKECEIVIDHFLEFDAEAKLKDPKLNEFLSVIKEEIKKQDQAGKSKLNLFVSNLEQFLVGQNETWNSYLKLIQLLLRQHSLNISELNRKILVKAA